MKTCWCGNGNLTEYSDGYFKCDECHTLVSKHNFDDFMYDVQSEENDLYGKNYWERSMTKATGKNTLSEVVDMYLSERVLYWLKYILKYVKLGSFVAEVGCGLGQLQYILKRVGYQQLAFELSPEICDYIGDMLNIDVHCGAFIEKSSAYDAILALDLFEHLIEPLDFMKKCSISLKDDGILCFQTPCYDPQLSFKEMKCKKGRFEYLLTEEQHIYLYSRESMEKILRKFGFEYIIFEPAFFGDDYDMFFFASKKEIHVNAEREVDDYLNSVENGRLIKALITLFDEKEDLYTRLLQANDDSTKRLDQVNELTGMLKESESDRLARGEQIETLTALLKDSEADRAARLEQINTLTEMIQKKKKRH